MSLYRIVFSRMLIGLMALMILAPAYGNTLRIGNTSEPNTLDPQRSQGVWEQFILDELFEPLVTHDAKGQIIPGLAREWHISPDGKTYTFQLRSASWSDGTPITADDAVFGLQRLLLPATASPNANLYYSILNARDVNTGQQPPQSLGVKALDAHTLVITLSEPTPYFLRELANSYAAPLPRHTLKTLDNQQWAQETPLVVSGPYRLAHWTPRIEVALKKNAAFYDAPNVHIDDVIFYPIEDASTSYNQFRTNGLDISYSDIPSSRLRAARDELGDEVRVFPIFAAYTYIFNQDSKSPLHDHRLREALNLAIQRELITKRVEPIGQRASYWLVSKAMSGGVNSEMYFTHWPMDVRLERAKALLKEAGYDAQHPLHLELSYNSLESHRKIAVALTAMWKPINVNISLVNREMGSHVHTMMTGQFQIARRGTQANVDDPIEMLSMYTTGSPDNFSHYSNPEFDRLIAESQHALDPKARTQLLNQAQQVLLDDMAFLPIFDYTAAHLVSHRISGWEANGLNVHPIRFMQMHDKT